MDGKKVRSKKQSLPQWVVTLESDNACNEHGGHGCLNYQSRHVQLTKQDLSTWALFMVKTLVFLVHTLLNLFDLPAEWLSLHDYTSSKASGGR